MAFMLLNRLTTRYGRRDDVVRNLIESGKRFDDNSRACCTSSPSPPRRKTRSGWSICGRDRARCRTPTGSLPDRAAAASAARASAYATMLVTLIALEFQISTATSEPSSATTVFTKAEVSK
jgi:hypothetical protein